MRGQGCPREVSHQNNSPTCLRMTTSRPQFEGWERKPKEMTRTGGKHSLWGKGGANHGPHLNISSLKVTPGTNLESISQWSWGGRRVRGGPGKIQDRKIYDRRAKSQKLSGGR